ncbi:MAG: ABC transporter ATP-binding protein [Culicoidibacterales bacterium]
MNVKSYSILFSHVTKEYAMTKTMKDKVLVFLTKAKSVTRFKALDDVSFSIKKGEVVGLIGLNGSGKSTLANLMIEATAPTKGQVSVNGHLELIAIGVGLNGELTGIENIKQKCFMLGMSRKQIAKITPDIIAFSELGEFIYQPIKKYSSGMKSRLGFAISIQTDPDVLVVDEALSVGDRAFADKCLKVIQELIKTDKTVVFVSHSNAQIKQFCDHVIWLDRGKVIADSRNLDEVLVAYDKYVSEKKKNINAIPQYNNNYAEQEQHDETIELRTVGAKNKKTKMQGTLKGLLLLLFCLLFFLIGYIIGFYLFW